MRILIAEDDPPSRLIHQMIVENRGHEAIVAENGEEAWRIFRSTEVDVVLSNWMMPDCDGLELCRRVREHKGSYAYFILLTARGDKEHVLEGIKEGGDDYLTKPLEAEELSVRLVSASRVTSLHSQLTEKTESSEKMNRLLFEQARKDPLTKLGNRLQLHEDLELMRGRMKRYGHSYSALLCDVDFFKPYNDHYGHLSGDEVLVEVANTIAEHLRSGDQAYRYGGEEFLIVLPEQTLKAAHDVAERIRQAVEDLKIPHNAKEPRGVITISVGVSSLQAQEEQPIGVLLEEADAALYRAKRSGRNRVVDQTREGGV